MFICKLICTSYENEYKILVSQISSFKWRNLVLCEYHGMCRKIFQNEPGVFQLGLGCDFKNLNMTVHFKIMNIDNEINTPID